MKQKKKEKERLVNPDSGVGLPAGRTAGESVEGDSGDGGGLDSGW